MSYHRDRGVLPAFLALALALALGLAACGALPGSSSGGAVSPGGGTPLGIGVILSPGDPLNATGERDSSAVDKDSGPTDASMGGGDAGYVPVSMPAMGGPIGGSMGGIKMLPADTAMADPLPGGYPAPSHDPDPGDDPLADEDCETYAGALDGIGTLCRKQDGGLLMTVDAFLRQCSGDKVLSDTFNDAYTLQIKNTATHKTVDIPLADGMMSTPEGPVPASGHVLGTVDFSTRPYPGCIGDLEFYVISNTGRAAPREFPVFAMRVGKVLPTSVLVSLPYGVSDLPVCWSLSEINKQIMTVLPSQ